jgi:exo-beta-1,3-glucanase (GH17 family)
MHYKKSICYSGYRLNQSPITKVYPSKQEILEDLQLLIKDGYEQIRMYDPGMHARLTLEVIKEHNLPIKVMQGMDLDGEVINNNVGWGEPLKTKDIIQNKKNNLKQLELLIELANQYPEIINYVSAGNENTSDWNPKMVAVETLAKYIRTLKENIKQPLTFCEGVYFWNTHAMPLVKEVDFVSIHIYPFWLRKPHEEALENTFAAYFATKENIKDKPIIITEAGWPTKSSLGDYTSNAFHRTYVDGLEAWAKKNDVLLYMFEAFDEPWKGSDKPDEPEKHWGVYDLNRNKK